MITKVKEGLWVGAGALAAFIAGMVVVTVIIFLLRNLLFALVLAVAAFVGYVAYQLYEIKREFEYEKWFLRRVERRQDERLNREWKAANKKYFAGENDE